MVYHCAITQHLNRYPHPSTPTVPSQCSPQNAHTATAQSRVRQIPFHHAMKIFPSNFQRPLINNSPQYPSPMDESQPPTESCSNTNTPSPSDIDELSTHLSSMLLGRKVSNPQPWTTNTGQWTHLIPGSSVEEQLRAIDTPSPSNLSLTLTQDTLLATAMQSLDINFANPTDVKNAMEAYLISLSDRQLSDLMSSTLHISFPVSSTELTHGRTAYTHFPPSPRPSSPKLSSPLFRGPFPSYPKGSLDAIKQLYIAALRASEDPDVLLDAPLPADQAELEELGVWMSELCDECGIVIGVPTGWPGGAGWVGDK